MIYSFGEREYYYDQFYEPYRDYPAPILALAGNHDGMAAPGVAVPTLAASVWRARARRPRAARILCPDAGQSYETPDDPGYYTPYAGATAELLVLAPVI